MDFRILGPLVVVGAAPVDLTGQRERVLLARLVVSANQVLSSERLVEDVWEDAPPDNAMKALPVYISRLRKALRGGGLDDVVVTCAPGYVLRLAPGDLDAARFEALVASGRNQAAAGNADDAAAALGEALALWRGPALADVAHMSFARAEAARLEEARLSAVEDRIDADLACGRHGGLIGELAALVAADPLRERLWGQRMLALYRAGRQAEALRAYQELREVLVEELGIEPSTALARLETAMLRHDEELEWEPVRPPLPARSVEATVEQAEPPAALSVPLPHFLTDVGRIFVGRDNEVARLEQLWKEAAAGERRVALLAGEPGVGKTRLAAELAGRAHNEGAVVLAGRCDEDLGVPYQPFVEALRQFADHTPSEHLRPRLGRYGGELARLVPELAERISELPRPLSSDPETERYRLFDAVAAWLAAVSAEAPVLIVLDDLQWAARPTLQLLRHVVHSAEAMRVLVLGAYRDSELAHDHALIEVIADLHRQGGAQRLALSGLDDAAVAAFVEQASGRSLDEDGLALVHAIYEGTEGNPFFVKEVLRHLAETGAVERREGGWATRLPVEQLGIPEGVRDVVGRRLSHLSRDANEVLRVAAVMGAEFDLAVLGTAEDLDDDDLVSALEEAIAARLVIEVAGPAPRYRFAHALVRDTLYQGLSAARRTMLHRRVAEALETVHVHRLDEHAPALAHHWARASAPAAEVDRAVNWAERAGDQALALLAHDGAMDWYRQAVELLDAAGAAAGDHRRVNLLVDFGDAQRRAGDPGYRQSLVAAGRLAATSGHADTLACAALANHRGFFSASGAVDVEAVGLLEAALEAVDPADLSVKARLLANLAEELGFSSQHDRRQRCAAEALSTARRLGHPVTLAHVLARRFSTVPHTPEVREDIVELAALATQLDDPTLSLWAGLWLALIDWATGDAAAFESGLAVSARRASELGQPLLRWVVAFIQSAAHRAAGRLPDAERLANEALAIAQAAGIPDGARIFGANQFWIRYDQGRLNELIGRLEAVNHPNPLTSVVLGLALCELDRLHDARLLLDRLAQDDFSVLPGNFARAYVLAVLAQVCHAVGDTERARLLSDWLTPHQGLVIHIAGAGIGSGDHYLGLLAATRRRFDDAETHFASATALHERMAAPTWLARTRLEWARMLLTRRRAGDVERARELLGQALAVARELGLGNVERRAVQLLASR